MPAFCELVSLSPFTVCPKLVGQTQNKSETQNNTNLENTFSFIVFVMRVHESPQSLPQKRHGFIRSNFSGCSTALARRLRPDKPHREPCKISRNAMYQTKSRRVINSALRISKQSTMQSRVLTRATPTCPNIVFRLKLTSAE